VFTVAGMFKSEALIFWIFWAYVVSKVRLLWDKILAPFTSNITAVNHCDPFCQNATGQTQLHYDWLL